MRFTGSIFTGASLQTRQKPVSLAPSARSSNPIVAAQKSDSFTLSQPRFGASQGGGTAVDYSAGAYAAGAPGGDDGDDKHYQKPLPADNTSVDWDSVFRELRTLMRKEAKKKGSKASTAHVMGVIEEKYGIELPDKVISGRQGGNKQGKLNKLLGTIKSGYLHSKHKSLEDNPNHPVTWTPVKEQEYRDPGELPSFVDVAFQAGSESHLSTEDRYLIANTQSLPPNSGNEPVTRSDSPVGWRQSIADNNLWRWHHGNGVYSEWDTWDNWNKRQ